MPASNPQEVGSRVDDRWCRPRLPGPRNDPRMTRARHGHRFVVANPDKHETRDELSSFNPTGGPRRSKFGPLLLTLAVLLLVFLIFAAVGWLRYNTG